MKKSCNDDMILFSFHINENLAFDAFQEEGWQTTLKGWEVSLQDHVGKSHNCFSVSFRLVRNLSVSSLKDSRHASLAGMTLLLTPSTCGTLH